jgi:hypothetical protein
MNPRVLEIVAQTFVGDGVTMLVIPRRHMLLWKHALPWTAWQRLVQWCADNPALMIPVGMLEILAGIALILRANRDSE